MGAVASKACHAAFASLLLADMMWAAAAMQCVHLLPLSKRLREEWSLGIVQFAWRLTFLFSPWVWRTPLAEEAEQWRKVRDLMKKSDAEAASEGRPPRPLFVLGNHTSFLDAVLSAQALPFWALRRCRTYMDQHLFQLPVLATICKCIGHFPVHFTSSEEGVFKVDAAKMEQVETQVDEHLKRGGWLCFFPEGQTNKNPDEIMPFRFGGMKRAIEFDAVLVSWVSYGNTRVWPRKAPVGGLPGRIRHSLEILAPEGAKAWVEELRQSTASAEEKKLPGHGLLAMHGRARMQRQYDELKAAPSSVLCLAGPCAAVLASAGLGVGAVVALRARRAWPFC